MGFWHLGNKKGGAGRKRAARIPVHQEDALKGKGCSACPLDSADLASPKMEPTGAEDPVFYVLGEAPGGREDAEGEQFVGKAGKTLRYALRKAANDSDSRFVKTLRRLSDDEDIMDVVRFNNTIRCRPPDNRDPEPVETACCRGYVEDDIARTKPKVIVGAGAVPLRWVGASVQAGVTAWRGRLFPVEIKGHRCWYYCILHPSYVNRADEATYEMFLLDLERLFQFMDTDEAGKRPKVYTEDDLMEGVECLEKPDDILEALAYFKERKGVVLDLETTAKPINRDARETVFKPQADDAHILIVGLSDGKRSVAFPFDHVRHPHSHGAYSRIRKRLRSLLNDPSIKKIAHNLSFDLAWVHWHLGVDYNRSRWVDTMGMAYALDERPRMLSLDTLSFLNLGVYLKPLSDVNVSDIANAPLDKALRYCALDARATFLVHNKLMRRLKREGLLPVYRHLMESAVTAAAMSNKGVPVSKRKQDELEETLQRQKEEIEARIQDSREAKLFMKKTGRRLNPHSSGADLQYLFNDLLQREEVLRTDRQGNEKVSTDQKALEAMEDCGIAQDILALRNVTKNLSTYVRGTRNLVFPDGRFHPNINVFLTSTGRLSCDSPNTQNFPKRKDKYIRKQVIAAKGMELLAADYGQIEYRVIAMASEDQLACEKLWQGQDIHMHWTEVLVSEYPEVYERIMDDYGLHDADEAKLKKKLRDEMKNGWVFPLCYGSAWYNCADNLKIPHNLAEWMYNEFWSQHRGLYEWQRKVVENYRRRGYVETLTGRRRHGPIKRGEIINSPIQGTASDIVVHASNQLRKEGVFDLLPVMNIHDDLTFELPKEELIIEVHEEGVIEQIAQIMSRPRFDFVTVPLLVEFEKGKRWDKMEEFVNYHSEKGFLREAA